MMQVKLKPAVSLVSHSNTIPNNGQPKPPLSFSTTTSCHMYYYHCYYFNVFFFNIVITMTAKKRMDKIIIIDQ